MIVESYLCVVGRLGPSSNTEMGHQMLVAHNKCLLRGSMLIALCVCFVGDFVCAESVQIWHKFTINFEGPQTAESAEPNPFTDYRLDVTFTKDDKSYVVPGYYAADSDAANSSAESGNRWRVHFSPDALGEWTWKASFRKGDNVAVSDSRSDGESAGFFGKRKGQATIAGKEKGNRER